MIKLKKLLKETYAWEKRNENGSLPTLEDVQAAYNQSKTNEVLKDKDGNPRTDLKYNEPSRAEKYAKLKASKADGSFSPPVDKIVSVKGSEPYVTVIYDNGDGTVSEVEFDDFADPEMTDPPYSGDTTITGADDEGNEWYVYASVDAAGGGDWNFEIDWTTMDKG